MKIIFFTSILLIRLEFEQYRLDFVSGNYIITVIVYFNSIKVKSCTLGIFCLAFFFIKKTSFVFIIFFVHNMYRQMVAKTLQKIS